jgi:hypothetical protein
MSAADPCRVKPAALAKKKGQTVIFAFFAAHNPFNLCRRDWILKKWPDFCGRG